MGGEGLVRAPAIDAVEAAKVVERIIGNAWAADAEGNFIYVTPAALAFFGISLESLNSRSDESDFGWKRVIHPEEYDLAAILWRRCLQTGQHYNVEHRMLRATGVYGWARSTGQPVRDRNGMILGWYGTVIDIALPSPQDNHDDPAAVAPQQDITRSMEKIHPHDRTAVEQAAARAFFHGIPQVGSYRQLQADGNYRRVEFRLDPQDPVAINIDAELTWQGDPWEETSSFREARNAVQAALAIEKLYGDAWAIDAIGQFIYATPAWQNSVARTLDELNALLDGKPFLDGGKQGWQLDLHPEDSDRAAETFRRCLRTGEHWNCEYRIRGRNETYVWHRAAARPTRDEQGRIMGWYGTALDIDAYKKTEAALRERERQLRHLVNTVPALIWSTSSDGTPAYVNRQFVEVTGATLEDITAPNGSPSLGVVHPDDRAAAREAFLRSIEAGIPYLQRYRQLRAGGSYHWTETRAEPLRDEAGKIIHWYGVSSDIHDLVTAQEALRESEQHLQQLVETLPALVYCALPDGKPIYRSQRLRQYLGFNLEDTDGLEKSRLDGTLDAVIHPDDLMLVKERYAHSLATGEPYLLRHRLRRFDGVYRWVETRASAMRNGDGEIAQWNGICLDIEDQVQAQEELSKAKENLARSSQDASLAELSASIAHEVNQPLSAVMNYSSACQRWLAADPPNIERAQKTLERIVRSANSAADVVGRIRALFRQSTDKRDSTELGAVVRQARELLAEEAGRRRIRVDIEGQSGLQVVPFDRVQIQQVLVNLMRNGMDAMASVSNDRVLKIRALREGDMVRVEVRDRGRGVQFPDRIFEPFFTTKDQGMGMGLAICRSIVEAHDGQLWAEKNEPRGAKFVFTLPLDVARAP
ncbi:PAS domain-containing sensor histidine kinase [Rhizobium sp. GR12]|uniref:PAS domain-containing sensor histidine kinase n=1 Tax=Rhizobium sp. GR12 TaxID=3053925 RepID=UPI002FBF0877